MTVHYRASHHERRGFALPAAIMALVLLSALVAGALYLSTEELRAGRGDLASQRALAAAESALERAIVTWDTRRNTALDIGASATLDERVSPNGDRATVTATRVQRMAVWLTAIATSPADGRPIPARHTLAASLRLSAPSFPLTAALTAAGMVTVRAGTVAGEDASIVGAMACADNAPADVAGLLVPNSLLACGATCSGAAPAGVSGAPAVGVDAALTTDSGRIALFGSEGRATLEQRATTLPAGTFVPRPIESAGVCITADPLNWGSPLGGACADHYRIVHVRGDAVLGAGAVGQGVFLVDGTLRLEPGARFDGVVVAGNDIDVTGTGAVINGAAFALDADRTDGSRVADGGEVRFVSCAVRRASLGVARLEHTPGRWWAELR